MDAECSDLGLPVDWTVERINVPESSGPPLTDLYVWGRIVVPRRER